MNMKSKDRKDSKMEKTKPASEPQKMDDELAFQLYEMRMLVFLEIAPQSNKYRQVLLSPKEYKKMSFSFGEFKKRKDSKFDSSVMCSEKIFDLPDLTAIV